MGVGGIFSGVGAIVNFPQEVRRIFPRGKNGEISFFPFKTKKVTFFIEFFIENVRFQNNGVQGLPAPFSDANV